MIKDGFILFYCKDGKVHSVIMTKDQLQTLQDFIPTIMGREIQIVDEPFGELYDKGAVQ